MTAEEVTYLPAGVDEIGTLANELGNLVGYDSLANELIQNADDAEGATALRVVGGDRELVQR